MNTLPGTEVTTEIKQTTAKRLNRDGSKKRQLRNLMKRGRIWYFKKTVNGRVKPVSLGTEDLELAKAKRNKLEQLALDEEWAKIEGVRTKAGTLQDIFSAYDEIGGLPHRTMLSNKIAMMTVVRKGTGDAIVEPGQVKLTVLTSKLVRDYQDKVRANYEGEVKGEKEKRSARDRADRTSKSTFNQAKALFAAKRSLIERYQEKGIAVPTNVQEFLKAGAVGKMGSKDYFPPSDIQMKQTFLKIEELREHDPECYYLFWAALATGCRRNELADMKVEDLQEIDGRRWVTAGMGKDGKPIRLPLINWQVHPANARTPASVMEEIIAERKRGHLFLGEKTERYDSMPDRLNAWLQRLGWNDEKKLHGLRAYIGSKLYERNPRLAQVYMRHKSIATTENHYTHFLELEKALNFDAADPTPAPSPAPLATVPTGAPVLTIVQTPGREGFAA